MLFTKPGFNAFNEFDLAANLEAQLSRLKAEVNSSIKAGNSSKIPIIAEKYKIQPLVLDSQNLTVETTTAQIPAEYFPNTFFVREGKSYPKDILIFHLPFSGDHNLLRCVPSQRILWAEKIALQGNIILFEVIKFSDDVNEIRKKRDEVVNFLIKQANNVNRQIEQYNEAINQAVMETEARTRSQLSKDEEFLAQLGTPVKTGSIKNSSDDENSQKSTSRVIENKSMTFDVLICYASEDKRYVVQLAKALEESEITVWYDAYQLGWGDDLRPQIDNGLKNSRYGVVVFSKSFLSKKKWTEYELNGLFSKEEMGKKVILPIWHNIDSKDVAEYSPAFTNRIAKRSNDIPSMVRELKRLLK